MIATATGQLVTAFVDTKDLLLASVDVSRDAMHVHLGLALFFTMHALRIWLWRGGWWLPLVLLAMLSLGAEWLDVQALHAVNAPFVPQDSARDVISTLAWPLVLTRALGLRRWWLRMRKRGASGKRHP